MTCKDTKVRTQGGRRRLPRLQWDRGQRRAVIVLYGAGMNGLVSRVARAIAAPDHKARLQRAQDAAEMHDRMLAVAG